MDFDEIVVKESPGLCRCCLSEGCYKDLGSEYSWMNETEIYADMLLECFDISISQHPTGPNGSNRLICEVCITRLRDACNFKKQVLESEKKFVDMIGRGEFRPKVLLYQPQMKTELSMELDEQTAGDDGGEVEYLEEDVDFVDEDLLKNEDYGEASVSEDITVSALAVKGKRGRPKKTSAKPVKKAKVAKVEEKPSKSRAVAKDANAIQRRRPYPADTYRIRKLLWLILLNSTAMPFKRSGNIYKCFYCSKTFHKSTDLTEHTKNHVDSNQRFRMVRRCDGRSSIKVDITGLKCNQCDKEFDTLENFLSHMKEAHTENIDMEALKYIDCFKLSDNGLKCLLCDEHFQYFNTLLLHTIRFHKTKQHICDLCGVCFASKCSIARHFQSAHETNRKTYKCAHCGKNFFAPHRLDDHVKRIHDVKARQCHICGEILGSTFIKANHLAAVHNFRSAEFKCESCPKIFRRQNFLDNHKRRIHLKEKTKVCDICGEKFFDNTLLSLHKVRHSDTKPFECSICKKKFPRKKGLDMHMRIHTGDKRCVCKVCGKAFVQTASLKLHERVHHGIVKVK